MNYRETSPSLTDFSEIADRLYAGLPVTQQEIVVLLSSHTVRQKEQLFSLARKVRRAHFASNIFLYGFLYFSTYCRNTCLFCQYRQSNSHIDRYRRTDEEILTAANHMAASGVHLVDLTMGEDPVIYSRDGAGVEHLLKTVKSVQAHTNLPVMLSPGALPEGTLPQFAAVGVDWYACYQETHNQNHFNRLRPGQNYDLRLTRKKEAHKLGMLIEEGILLGTGETLEDVANSLLWMRDNQVDQVRAMTFVPEPNTPMLDKQEHHVSEEVVIAVMRLLMPDRLIPASLDVEGLNGLQIRLDAGANVITSIVPPDAGLAGVANQSLDIDDNRRSRSHIAPILAANNLQVAGHNVYRSWLAQRKQLHAPSRSKSVVNVL